MEYVIRRILQCELEALVKLCASHAKYECAAYNPKGKKERLYEAIFSGNPKLHAFVIAVNAELAGYFTFTFDSSTWDAQFFLHLDCLYLEPDFRGMRIGDAVFEQLKSIANENNCVNIQWQTPVFNEKAIKFYRRIGAAEKEKLRFFIDL